MIRFVIVLGLLLLGSAAALVWLGVRSLDQPLALAAPALFKVAPGTSFARVAAELSARGLIAQPRAWVLYARLEGLASAIKAGEYEIDPGATPRQLLEKMVNGQVVLHSLTIVDGWRVEDLLAALRRNPDILVTLPASPQNLMARLGDLPLCERHDRCRGAAPSACGDETRARRRLGRPRPDGAVAQCR